MLDDCAGATTSDSCRQLLRDHLQAMLLCPDKATLTNLICTAGGAQADWSAHYRLYSKQRVEPDVLFGQVREHLLAHLPAEAPLVVAVDDTLVRKTGTRIDGVRWRRDPLGPAFQTNLVRGQRYLQFSAAWPVDDGQARLVPIGFWHTPGAGKPPKDATGDQLLEYRERSKQQQLNTRTLGHLRELRAQVPARRRLILNGDGSYTNATLLKELPDGSVYIGRIRKDAALHHLPAGPVAPTGRRPSYGPAAPTPEQLRQDEAVAWQTLSAYAAGRRHDFRIKTLDTVLWRKSGPARKLRLVVIAPLAYKLRAGARTLYRQPAYLVCTDPDLPLQELLQYYLWRWGIEVNFREEKQLLGAGQAQVRTAASNQHLPATVVAAYALLWTAALRSRQAGAALATVPPPHWRRRRAEQATLPSTGDLIRRLRFETWAGALRPACFHHFVSASRPTTKPQKLFPCLPQALFAAA